MRNWKRGMWLIGGMLCLAMLVMPAATAAGVPATIGFQGLLTDTGGTPLEGSQLMVFAIHDDPTADSVVWSEQQTVDVQSGVFDVRLGAAVPLSVTDFADADLYLEVSVFTSGSGWEALSPRQPLTSTAFSMKAGDADTLQGHAIADLDATYVLRGETGAVTSDMIADDSIGSDDLTDNSLTAADLASDSVQAAEIAAGAVGTSEIADGSVTAADLADDYVNTSGDAMTGSLVVGGILSVGANAGNDDDYLQMDAGNEYLQWDDYQTRFQLSDALNVEGALAVGYRTTQPVYSVIGYGTPESGVVSDINDLLVTNDLEVNGYIFGENITSNGYVRAYGTLYVGTDAADDDDYIRMDSGYEYLRWEDDLDDDSANGLDGGFYFSDEIQALGSVSIAGATGEFMYDSPRTRRLNLPACAFVKDDAYQDTVWNMTSSYAYTSTAGTSSYCYAYAPVYLPEGATVNGVQVQYYDNDDAQDVSVTFALRRASITNASAQNLAYRTVTSSGESTALRFAEDDDGVSYDSIESSYNYSMYLAWNPTGLSSNLRFYGATITYTVGTVGY